MTEQDYDPEFKGMPMWDQLGKILDSAENPVPRDWVKTDDGVVIDGISAIDAQNIRDLLLDIAKPADRLHVIREMQESTFMNQLLSDVQVAV